MEKVAEKIPIFHWRGGNGVNASFRLRELNKIFSDDAVPGIFNFLPAENLAGIERGGEVVVADGQGNFRRGHIYFISAKMIFANLHGHADIFGELGGGFAIHPFHERDEVDERGTVGFNLVEIF